MNAKRMSKFFSVLCLFSISSVATAAPTVGFDNSNISVKVGDIFSVNVIGNDFLADVDGGGFNLLFDKALLKIDSITVLTSLWEFLPQNGTINNADGTASEIQFNTFAHHNKGTFNIASLQFTALSAGIGQLNLSESINNPFASGGDAINPTFLAGNVKVASAVPLPGALWLMMSSLGALGLMSRKNKQS